MRSGWSRLKFIFVPDRAGKRRRFDFPHPALTSDKEALPATISLSQSEASVATKVSVIPRLTRTPNLILISIHQIELFGKLANPFLVSDFSFGGQTARLIHIAISFVIAISSDGLTDLTPLIHSAHSRR